MLALVVIPYLEHNSQNPTRSDTQHGEAGTSRMSLLSLTSLLLPLRWRDITWEVMSTENNIQGHIDDKRGRGFSVTVLLVTLYPGEHVMNVKSMFSGEHVMNVQSMFSGEPDSREARTPAERCDTVWQR